MKSAVFTIVPGLGLAIFASLPFAAQAQDFAMVGASSVTCAKYNADRQNKVNAIAYQDGAQGFLSGFNMAARVTGKLPFKKLPDAARLKAGLDSYCGANADQAVARGLMLIWKDLPDLP